MHSWGSRGRRFKSGRPDAAQGPLITVNAEVSGLFRAHAPAHDLPRTTRSWGPSGDRRAVKWALRASPASRIDEETRRSPPTVRQELALITLIQALIQVPDPVP
jgi:hypothetical protein